MNSFHFPTIILEATMYTALNQYVEKLILKFINRLLRNEKCCIHGDAGSNRRHYLHVLDTVSAFDLVLHNGG